jgi:hypothetical protein
MDALQHGLNGGLCRDNIDNKRDLDYKEIVHKQHSL